MKYVLMYTNRPDLDAAVPEELGRPRSIRRSQPGSRSTAMSWPMVAPNSRPRDCDDGQVRAGRRRAGRRGRPCSPRRRRTSEGSASSTFFDLDAAIAVVKEWPSLQYPGVAVEIRPIGDHSGGM